MRELYVYYRVAPQRAARLLPQILSLQARLRAEHAGLVARLLRRAELIHGVETWMETYSSSTHGGVTPALQAAIESAAAAGAICASLDGPRHTEVFVPCA